MQPKYLFSNCNRGETAATQRNQSERRCLTDNTSFPTQSYTALMGDALSVLVVVADAEVVDNSQCELGEKELRL